MGRSHTLQNKEEETFLNLVSGHLGLGHRTELSWSALSILNLGKHYNEARMVEGFQGCGAESSDMVTSVHLERCQCWLPW